VRLFHRSTRGVRLTEAGAHFASQIESPYQALAAAGETLRDADQGPCGVLRLTTSEVLFEWLLLPVIAQLQARAPKLRIELDLNNLFVDIVMEGFDAGIRLDEAVGAEMIGRRIAGPQPCAVVAAPAYLDTAPPPPQRPDDLTAHRCIGWSIRNRLVPWEFGAPGAVRAIDLTPALTLSTHAACIAAAKAGMGIAYAVPRAQVATALASGALVELLPGQAALLPPLMVYYASRRHLPKKVEALVAELVAFCGKDNPMLSVT